MANMKSTITSLWAASSAILDTTVEVVNSASLGVNELSDRTRDWAELSRVDRESTKELRIKDRVSDRLMSLAKAKAKRSTELTKDAELASVYAEMENEVFSRVEELLK